MTDITIAAADGGSFKAYVARPAQTPAPVIIVIQEIFGVNAELRQKCDHLAGLGHVAVCPDLFWRIEPGIELVDSKPDELQRAFDLFGQFDVGQGIEDLKATLTFMRSYEHGNGTVGCVGYCLGGKLAYLMACRTGIDASVSYYGVGIENMLEESANLKNPLLLHIAGKDQFVPRPAQQMIMDALSPNPRISVHRYEGVDHAFARGQGMHYDEEAAKLANARTEEFFAKNLK